MRFSSKYKLKTQKDYRKVFSKGEKSVGSTVLLLSINNNLNMPRLGLAVPKKNIRLASDRNRVKRLIRESFRQYINQLPNKDFVVLVKHSINAKDRHLYSKLSRQWERYLS